ALLPELDLFKPDRWVELGSRFVGFLETVGYDALMRSAVLDDEKPVNNVDAVLVGETVSGDDLGLAWLVGRGFQIHHQLSIVRGGLKRGIVRAGALNRDLEPDDLVDVIVDEFLKLRIGAFGQRSPKLRDFPLDGLCQRCRSECEDR